MRFGIRLQMLAPLLSLMLCVVAVSTWSAWQSGRRARDQIEQQMRAIATTTHEVTIPRNLPTLQLMKRLSGADFLMCDDRRSPLLDDQGRPITTLGVVPSPLPTPQEDIREFDANVQVGDQAYVCVGSTLRPGLILYIFFPRSAWEDAARQALVPAMLLGLLGGGAAVLLSFLVTQRLTRRIQELERRTRDISGGDFSPMPVPKRNDELRDLTCSVNDMAAQLAVARQSLQHTERLRVLGQIGGGLAHQLRNAAAGAKLAVQLHRREFPRETDGESLAVALRQLELMELHLKRFLDVGRDLTATLQPCQVSRLVDDAVALLLPQCKHAGIELTTEPSQSSADDVQCDAYLVGQLLVNLLTNAAEAAGPGGRVAIRTADRGPSAVQFDVLDSGPGPTATLGDRVFEPFATSKPEGVGLGLALARQIATAHGGTLTWHREENTTCFRFVLPRTPLPSARTP